MEDKAAFQTPSSQGTPDKSKPAKPATDASTNQDSATPAVPAPATDAASATLAAMLFGTTKSTAAPAAIKEQDKTAAPAITADTTATITPATTADAASITAAMQGFQTQPLTHDTNTGKSLRPAGGNAVHQTAIGAVRENPATAAMPRADAAMLTATKAGAALLKSTDLAGSLPSSAPTDQALAQSASTLVAASLPPDKAATITNTTTIAAPLTSSAWPAEFAQKINWVSTQQNQTAELHLNPPDLGPMSVVLSVSDNQATAIFSSPHSAVRDAIENAMPKLRESLAENGIMLGNTSVNDQAPRDNGASNFTDQRGDNRRTAEVEGSTVQATSLPVAPTRRHNGMVDTFA
jgi:flagellar hook-length control protein FliK